MLILKDNNDYSYTYLPIKCRARQEVFEKVGHHLMNQGVRSMVSDAHCAYRGQDGTMCAAGVLLPDSEVNSFNNTGMAWGYMFKEGPVIYTPTEAQLDRIPFMTRLIRELQSAHDSDEWNGNPFWMRARLREIAINYNLSATFLEDYFEDLSPDPDRS